MTAADRTPNTETERVVDEAQDAQLERPKLERTLAFVVVFLGILLVAGLVAVAARVIYLSSHGGKQPTLDGATKTVAAPLHPAAGVAPVPFALPKGADIKSIALDGTRVAVHYGSAEGAGILIVDQATGETVAHLKVQP